MLENVTGIDTALKSFFGSDCRIVKQRPVSGGDINQSFLLELHNGERVFLKKNRSSLQAMFAAEALGLNTLGSVAARSEAPPVPKPLAWGIDGRDSFLLMDSISPGRLASAATFGRSLADLHRNGRSSSCGFDSDNWIGLTTQSNERCSRWADFFATRRLSYQWELAARAGFTDSDSDKSMDLLLGKLGNLLPEPESGGAHLLHGDLWGGNWMAGPDGRAYLIDPAVYYGHREADMAMTELFGGFPPGFKAAYLEAWPLEPGFNERIPLYNLYHLLNHLNLFGASYWPSVRSILRRFGG